MKLTQRITYPRRRKKSKKRALPAQKQPLRQFNILSNKIRIKSGSWVHDGVPCNGFVFTNRTNTVLIGKIFYQAITVKTAKIRYRKVNTSLRGRGVGSQILSFLEDHLREEGFEEVTANTRQPESALFFLKNGYTIAEIKNVARIPKTVNAQQKLVATLALRQEGHINQLTFVKNLSQRA